MKGAETLPALAGLKKRSEFLFIAQGDRVSGRFLSLQGRIYTPGYMRENPAIHFGITASKKVGNAVKRNRAKRRLRVALKQSLPKYGQSGFAYVAIARPQTIEAEWKELIFDLDNLLKRLSKNTIKRQITPNQI